MTPDDGDGLFAHFSEIRTEVKSAEGTAEGDIRREYESKGQPGSEHQAGVRAGGKQQSS